jgi:hypothetical protein
MEHSTRFAPFVLTSVLVLGGCGDRAVDRAVAAEPTVRDSAGITIVENTAPLWGAGQGWRLSVAPVTEIGMLEGAEEYQLDQVRHAARLADGSVAIADGGSQRIRLYDAHGRHLRDLGGRGGGPGEFEGLSMVRPFRGDSIAAWDGRQKRLTVFDGSGQVGRVWVVDGVSGMMAPAVGWFTDGSLALMPGMDPMALAAAEPGERRETRRYLRASVADGVATLVEIPGRDEVVYREATSFGTRTVLFGRGAFAAARDDLFVAGESGRFEVVVHEADGSVDRIIRVLAEPRAVTSEELAAARERAMEARRESARLFAQQLGRAMPEEDRLALPSRDTHPFFDHIELDATGHLWVREPAADPDAARRWQVFDPEGRWLGAVDTPRGLRVTEIGDDHILGIHRDEYEVEYVRMYAIHRTTER